MNTENNSKGLSLSISNLTIRFDSRTVLNNLDIQIRAGDFVAIVGRSGCGKSTLLRLLAQLETPSSGTISSNNMTHREIKEHTRLMFQDSRLLPWKKVIDNVGLGLNGNWKDHALQALEDVGLKDRAYEWSSSLSGGQKQRVALARALIHQPRLLLLDEPLGALDALTRMEMQQLIEKLWKKYGFTVLLVTHDINEAVLTSNRVLLIEKGNIDLDLSVNIPRPRQELTELAKMEQLILDKILNLDKNIEYMI
jgi:sulfonate transport system ATP-binding protein